MLGRTSKDTCPVNHLQVLGCALSFRVPASFRSVTFTTYYMQQVPRIGVLAPPSPRIPSRLLMEHGSDRCRKSILNPGQPTLSSCFCFLWHKKRSNHLVRNFGKPLFRHSTCSSPRSICENCTWQGCDVSPRSQLFLHFAMSANSGYFSPLFKICIVFNRWKK